MVHCDLFAHSDRPLFDTQTTCATKKSTQHVTIYIHPQDKSVRCTNKLLNAEFDDVTKRMIRFVEVRTIGW